MCHDRLEVASVAPVVAAPNDITQDLNNSGYKTMSSPPIDARWP